MDTIWTDLITPAELTVYARQEQDTIEKAKGSLAAFLPGQAMNDTVARFTRTDRGMLPAAEYRSWDAESSIGGARGGQRVTIELAPVSQKLRVGELDTLRSLAATPTDAALRTVGKATTDVVRAVEARVEALRGAVIETGKVKIDENEFKVEVDLGRSDEMTVTAATKWDQASSDPITDLMAWAEKYSTENDEFPGVMLTSRKAAMQLLRNETVRKAVGGVNTPSIATADALNGLLQSYGLPAIQVYDRSVNINGKVQKVLDEKKLFFLPSDANALGSTFWGRTAEANDPDYGLVNAEVPGGIVAAALKRHDPYSYWVRANAVVVPVLTNPNASMVATVLT